MNNLKSYNSFIKESVQEEEEEVWVPVEDKLGFYEPKKILKSLLKKSLGFNKGNSVPFFLSQRKCKDWCDEKDQDMYQNMDR